MGIDYRRTGKGRRIAQPLGEIERFSRLESGYQGTEGPDDRDQCRRKGEKDNVIVQLIVIIALSVRQTSGYVRVGN